MVSAAKEVGIWYVEQVYADRVEKIREGGNTLLITSECLLNEGISGDRPVRSRQPGRLGLLTERLQNLTIKRVAYYAFCGISNRI